MQTPGGNSSSSGPLADGTAQVGGIGGFYVCDGGCDKATIGNVYAEALAKAGHPVHYYKEPLKATLCDGTQRDAIIGYVVADVTLKTAAGKVTLEKTNVDILKGPEKNFILYLGQAEETRLNLKSYARQLEEMAERSKAGLVVPPEEEANPQNSPPIRATQVKTGDSVKKVKFDAAEQPRYKRRLAKAQENFGTAAKVEDDGKAFVGTEGWKSMVEVKYLREPAAQQTYVTTTALAGEKTEYKQGCTRIRKSGGIRLGS